MQNLSRLLRFHGSRVPASFGKYSGRSASSFLRPGKAAAPFAQMIAVTTPHDEAWGLSAFEVGGGFQRLFGDENVLKVSSDLPLENVVDAIAAASEDNEPFYVVDLTDVLAKLAVWKELLPRVKPFYAYKCNNDAYITRLLAEAGCGFDCASQPEIQAVLDMGVSPDSIVYANPCKSRTMLRFAAANGVLKMTADNVDELVKIKELVPDARVILRIAVDDSKSVCRFNSKFGAFPAEWGSLLSTCRDLDLDVAGFSFHVGSGCGDVRPFVDAVERARAAFDLAQQYGFTPSILDCGGGYPGVDNSELKFGDIAAAVSQALDAHFPASSGVEIIGEPGRYMVASSHTYAVSVIAKRRLTESQLADSDAIETFGSQGGGDSGSSSSSNTGDVTAAAAAPDVALYINDGCYGSFNCVVFDHAEVEPRVLPPRVQELPTGGLAAGGKLEAPTVMTKLFGPTCDSIDVVMPCTPLPELSVGDWLWFPNMGAYTRCAASTFNGFGSHEVHYLARTRQADELLKEQRR